MRSSLPTQTSTVPRTHIPLSRINGEEPPGRVQRAATAAAAILLYPFLCIWNFAGYILRCLHPPDHEALPRDPLPWQVKAKRKAESESADFGDRSFHRKSSIGQFWTTTLDRYETYSSVQTTAKQYTETVGSRFREWRIRNRPALAEFAGSTLLALAGFGVAARLNLTNPGGDHDVIIKVVWGVATIVGLYITGGVSEGHMNPVVTFAYSLRGRFPWHRVPAYLVAQLVGYFLGAAMVFWLLLPEIRRYDPDLTMSGDTQTVTLFLTAPADYRSHWDEFLWETLVSGAMALNSLACADARNGWKPDPGLKPFALGMGVIAIRVALGKWRSHYALNPARDFGGRLFACIVYGGGAFTRNNNYFWIPLFGPIIGAFLGTAFYAIFVLH
ncbi:MAG: aquaporin-like protein [Piptocephalis tieghemiana]|nr:MAG: aquaporin-like protein [Piptocephalis tieghemiana]